MAGDAIMREVDLTLPLELDVELEAAKTATSIARAMLMSGDKIDEVRMAVVEACINAIEYSRATDGKVHLTFQVLGTKDPRTLRITVRDHGVGFDPNKVVKPDIGRILESDRKRGWGLQIIQGLMDDVTIRSGKSGTTLVMTKSL